MKKLDSVEDQMRGIVTYELSDGRRVALDARAVREYGAHAMLRNAGLGDALPTEWVPVQHHGMIVGKMAPDFDPDNIKSLNPVFYDPRPGDFRREGDLWIASRTLGPGDLDAVQGFVRVRAHEQLTVFGAEE